MRPVTRLLAVPGILLCLQIAACASVADKNIAYRDARPAPPLEIPADLGRPTTEQRMEIPPGAGTADSADFAIDVRPPSVIADEPATP